LVAGVLLFPGWIRGRIELRRKTKALQEVEADLERLRREQQQTSSLPESRPSQGVSQ
jgi:lipopolysaccharide assembly protein A